MVIILPRNSVKIELTNEERYELEKNVKSQKIEKRLFIRSSIVLFSAQGLQSKEIAQKLGVTEKTALKWRNRFAKYRLEGISDLERPGAPETFTELERLEIIRMSCSEPPIARNWTLAYLTEESSKLIGRSISIETIRQILRTANKQTAVLPPSKHQMIMRPVKTGNSGEW